MRKRIITVFFLAMTLAAFIGWVFGVESRTREMRKMAEVPEVSALSLIDSDFYSQLNDSFNDHFPFRGYLIKTKNWIDYRIFKTSPSNKIVIGTDGWLYIAESMEDYFKDSCGESVHMRVLARELGRLERAVTSMGKKFLFVVAPNKSTIYPEHVGIERPANRCGKSRYDLLLEAFEEFPVRGFIRLDDRLLGAKQRSQVYFKTDTHWNDIGALIASRAIIERIAPMDWKGYFPAFEFEETKINFDLSGFVDMPFTDWKEEATIIKDMRYLSRVKEEQRERLEDGWPRPIFTAEPLPGKTLLPRTFMYRDSFMKRPLNILKGSFKRIDTLWTHTIPYSIEVDYDDFMASDIIIVEVVERHLKYLYISVDDGVS